MLRYSLLMLVSWLLLGPSAALRAENVLIPQSLAQRHGLTKAWYAQVDLDKSSDHIAYITQQGGMLYVQTSHATVHALDAETGLKIWSVQIGRRNQMSYAPGVNDNFLAVINGSNLYVVEPQDRQAEMGAAVDHGARRRTHAEQEAALRRDGRRDARWIQSGRHQRAALHLQVGRTHPDPARDDRGQPELDHRQGLLLCPRGRHGQDSLPHRDSG